MVHIDEDLTNCQIFVCQLSRLSKEMQLHGLSPLNLFNIDTTSYCGGPVIKHSSCSDKSKKERKKDRERLHQTSPITYFIGPNTARQSVLHQHDLQLDRRRYFGLSH